MTNEQKIQLMETQITDLTRTVNDLKIQLMEINKFNSATLFIFKDLVSFDAQSKIGFYGKDPIKQQSLASDTLANLLTALRAYGLIT